MVMQGELSRKKMLNILFYALFAEKVIQHLFLAIFFSAELPGIGTPDLGSIQVSNGMMASLNLVYSFLFVIGIVEKNKVEKRATRFIVLLAFLDILLEFVFHGFFFITVSVIVSTLLIIVSNYYLKIDAEETDSTLLTREIGVDSM